MSEEENNEIFLLKVSPKGNDGAYETTINQSELSRIAINVGNSNDFKLSVYRFIDELSRCIWSAADRILFDSASEEAKDAADEIMSKLGLDDDQTI